MTLVPGESLPLRTLQNAFPPQIGPGICNQFDAHVVIPVYKQILMVISSLQARLHVNLHGPRAPPTTKQCVAAHGTIIKSGLERKKRETEASTADQHASVLELCIHASNGIRDTRS
jgi:hypothetical protein